MGILEVIGILFLQFIMGYGIAVTSREVRKVWRHCEFELSFTHKAPLRLLLYPASTIDMIECRRQDKPGCIFKDFGHSPWYVVLHLFFWEIRIAANLLFLFIAIFVPMFYVLIISPIIGIGSIFRTFTVKEEKN